MARGSRLVNLLLSLLYTNPVMRFHCFICRHTCLCSLWPICIC